MIISCIPSNQKKSLVLCEGLTSHKKKRRLGKKLYAKSKEASIFVRVGIASLRSKFMKVKIIWQQRNNSSVNYDILVDKLLTALVKIIKN